MFTGDRKFGDSGFQQRNQNTEQGENREFKRKPKVFVPVTVKMICDSVTKEDDQVFFNNQQLSDVVIVGRLLCRVEEKMRTIFELNDNTGTFRVVFYSSGEADKNLIRDFEFEQHCYVKIFGNLKTFREEKQLVGVCMERLSSYNDLTNHLLQVFTALASAKFGVLSEDEIKNAKGIKKAPQLENASSDEAQTVLRLMKTFISSGRDAVSKREIISRLSGNIQGATIEACLKKLEQ